MIEFRLFFSLNSFIYFCLMRWIQHVFDFYIFSNIHVAFATFSLTKITLLSFGNEQNELPLFVFFSTVVSYNFIRFYRKSTIQSWVYDWIETNRLKIILVSMVSLIGVIYFGLNLSVKALLVLFPFMMLTLFYVLPLKILAKRTKSLRTLSSLKIFLIAFCWAGITVILPLINYEIQFSTDILIIFIRRFLFVLVITLPFDIRDLRYDDESLKTLPQLLGIEKVKKLGLLMLMLFLGLLFLRNDLTQSTLRIEFIIAIISLLLLVRAKEYQHKYYSAFFVESIPILWLLLMSV